MIRPLITARVCASEGHRCPMCGRGGVWTWEVIDGRGVTHHGSASTESHAINAMLHFVYGQGWRVEGFQSNKDFFEEIGRADDEHRRATTAVMAQGVMEDAT